MLLLAAGCGGEAGDLMAIEVSGGVAKARGPLEIVVEGDGRATCNEQRATTLPSDLVIDAREIERDLSDLAADGARFEAGRTASGARYVVRTNDGTVRWEERAQNLPEVLPRTQLLALKLDRLLCR